jgi:hypothetical protein
MPVLLFYSELTLSVLCAAEILVNASDNRQRDKNMNSEFFVQIHMHSENLSRWLCVVSVSSPESDDR